MGLFDKHKQQSALNRMQEEKLFAFVLKELESGHTKPGLYAQALVSAEGDEKKARAKYIELRVQSVKDEFTIEQLVREEYRKDIEKVGGIKQRKPVQEENDSRYAFGITARPKTSARSSSNDASFQRNETKKKKVSLETKKMLGSLDWMEEYKKEE